MNIRLLFFVSIIFPSLAYSQSRVTVKSADSLAFLIKLNDSEINQWPCLVISFDFPVSGKINADVSFPVNPERNFSQILNLKKNYSYFFEVEKSKGILKLVLKSESLLQREMEASGVPQPLEGSIAESNDVQTTDSTLSISSACGQPVSEAQYQQMLNDVKESYFESRKLESMKLFLASNCVSVEQLRFMLSRLSMEDNKITLLRDSGGHVSDIVNLRKIEEDFFLQKNKALVYEITRSMQAHPAAGE